MCFVFVCCIFFFFFKQKTAYEMRISDWSSDVCSSDLATLADGRVAGVAVTRAEARLRGTDLATAPRGRLSLDAETRYGPAGAAAQFALAEPGILALHDLTARFVEDRKSTRLNSSH